MAYDQPSIDRLNLVAPLLKRKVIAGMDAFAAQGHGFRVAQGLRTSAEQDALYAMGRTAPGHMVTNARGGWSNHNFGCAVDCYPFLVGSDGALDLTDSRLPVFEAMVNVLKAQGLAWGGDWLSIHDAPHFQLANVPATPTDADRKMLAAGGLRAVWEHYGAL